MSNHFPPLYPHVVHAAHESIVLIVGAGITGSALAYVLQ